MTLRPPFVSSPHIQASVHEADKSGKYDPLPVKVPVEAVKTWHDAEARGKGLGKLVLFFGWFYREVDEPPEVVR